MNIFIAILLVLAAVGLVDQLAGGRLGLGAEFDHGIHTMGGMALSLVGIYCIGITVVQNSAQQVAQLSSLLPFDPSLLIGCLLAPDLGGYSIAKQMAATPALGLFSGLIVASTLGCTMSFVLPIAMSSIKKEEEPGHDAGHRAGHRHAAILRAGGQLAHRAARAPAAASHRPHPGDLPGALPGSAKGAQSHDPGAVGGGQLPSGVLSFSLFALVVAGLFIPQWQIADPALVQESLVVVVKITAVVCGAMVLSHIALTRFRRPILWLARKLRVNEASVVGLLCAWPPAFPCCPSLTGWTGAAKRSTAPFPSAAPLCWAAKWPFWPAWSPPRDRRLYGIQTGRRPVRHPGGPADDPCGKDVSL